MSTVLLTSCFGLSSAFGQQSNPAASPDAPSSDTPAGQLLVDTRPTDESIRQLLEVMEIKTMLDAIPGQMDAYFTSILNKDMAGRPISAEQQESIDKMRQKSADMIKEVFNWKSMEAVYLEVYGKTFSQSEIDSMITFYSSPAGHAVVVKLPLAMQNTMSVMQKRMQDLMPKIQQMAKDTAAEIKAPQAGIPKPKTG
jgi:hypothetical protein